MNGSRNNRKQCYDLTEALRDRPHGVGFMQSGAVMVGFVAERVITNAGPCDCINDKHTRRIRQVS